VGSLPNGATESGNNGDEDITMGEVRKGPDRDVSKACKMTPGTPRDCHSCHCDSFPINCWQRQSMRPSSPADPFKLLS
jgi:hypothetical protein